MRTRGEGVQNPENFADVLYVWSLMYVELWFPGDTEKENHVFHYLLGCREVALLLAKPVVAYGPVLVR